MKRRTFLASATLAGLAATLKSSGFAWQDAGPPPRVGLIGCGWFGCLDLESLLQAAPMQVVSLCDPNAQALAVARELVARYQSAAPKTFANYLQMLDGARHDIVIVATPDHWHALPAIAAMQAGADVYLEKPVGVDMIEGEALVAAARKYNRVVQVNTQRRSNPLMLSVREDYIHSGRLGQIALVEGFCFLDKRPADVVSHQPPPEHLDYELWTGPAPLKPFVPVVESRGWRSFMEYGNGIVGDMGVHIVDQVRWALGLGWPASISSTGGTYVAKGATANIHDTQRAVFQYPDLEVSWEHRSWGRSPVAQRHWTDQWGARFIGTRGTLTLTTFGYEFTPIDGATPEGVHLLSATGDLQNVDFSGWLEAFLKIQQSHVIDFLQARASRSKPAADIEEGHISSACCILANLAQELRRPLTYDSITKTVLNDEEATARLARPYRAPWAHPQPSTI